MTKSMPGTSKSGTLDITCFGLGLKCSANNRAGPAMIVYRHSVCYHRGKVRLGLYCLILA